LIFAGKGIEKAGVVGGIGIPLEDLKVGRVGTPKQFWAVRHDRPVPLVLSPWQFMAVDAARPVPLELPPVQLRAEI
jgi:hypothetical protein